MPTVDDSPKITTHPRDARDIVPETNVSFAVEAHGVDLQYCWQRKPLGGEEETEEGWKCLPTDTVKYEGADSATLLVHSTQKADESSYRCVISNASGHQASNPAIITVGRCLLPDKWHIGVSYLLHFLFVADPPHIETQPDHKRDVIPQKEVTFQVKATGTEPLRYSWEWNESFVETDSVKKHAANEVLLAHFYTLTKSINPDAIAPALFAERIIDSIALQNATNPFLNIQHRAQELLRDLLQKVQARPTWFCTICDIIEKATVVPEVDTIRGENAAVTNDSDIELYIY